MGGNLKTRVERVGVYGWVRFISGLVCFVGMLFVEVYLKFDIEVMLYAFPAYLLGMDLTKFIKPK